jgi:predicted dehydrogenase
MVAAVPLAPPSERVSGAENYRLFARMMRHGSDHPLSGLSAYHDQEIVMAIYESARRHGRVTLPLRQPEFPLELMLRDVQRG